MTVCRHKFASNVCEKALLHASMEDRRILIDELIDAQPDGSTRIPMLLRDAYGNFPLQTALQCAEEDQKVELLDLIIPVLPQIRQTPVGKRMEARLAQWENDGIITSATQAGANTEAYLEATDTLRRSSAISAETTDSDISGRSPGSDSPSTPSTVATSPSTPQADKFEDSAVPTPIFAMGMKDKVFECVKR